MPKFIEYAIRSHFHLAFFCFVYVYGLYHSVTNSWAYALMFSLGIMGVYNFHRLWKYQTKDLPDYIVYWVSKNKSKLLIIAISSSLATLFLYLKYFGHLNDIHLLTCIAVILSVLYVYRLRSYNLREVPYLKIFLVFAIWFFLLHYLPYLIFDILTNPIEGALFLFAILIPSDMKDITYDPKVMRTIPQIIGIKRSLILIQIIVMSGFLYSLMVPSMNTYIWLLGFSYLFSLTLFYKKFNPQYFFTWIDLGFLIVGLSLLWH
jgi:hypothetical protein